MDIADDDLVMHTSTTASYGAGKVVRLVNAFSRPVTQAFVQFDDEPAPRLVMLRDITVTGKAPAPVPRICWPLDRAGEVAS